MASVRTPVFLWVRGLRGPEPQRWSEAPDAHHNSQARLMIPGAIHPLTSTEAGLSLDELSRRYPAPQEAPDAPSF
ncbi:hypothetical protein GCM10007301_15080 [Azorhizobium oxalatiphilum]|uniref:Uncharacterized protein n=1 Tax=Azorhizobium oxalatiphilum TaxID=980631 RepID=A0A917F6T6_9HYPH|nr:hypothetical protein [Azorhizobium oxalatiphilum]GGF56412.1 hypothetical protein GCM10007301_15080 [Azorhizobium oxalatiphilum]